MVLGATAYTQLMEKILHYHNKQKGFTPLEINRPKAAVAVSPTGRSLTGFTLIEILLVIVIVGLLAGVGVPIYQALQNRNDLDIAASAVVQDPRRAPILAQSVSGDSTWGARILPGSVVVFKGASYATRDQSYDETFSINTSLVISGIQEVVFAKLSGLPQTTGNTVLTSRANEARTITINSKGTVSY